MRLRRAETGWDNAPLQPTPPLAGSVRLGSNRPVSFRTRAAPTFAPLPRSGLALQGARCFLPKGSGWESAETQVILLRLLRFPRFPPTRSPDVPTSAAIILAQAATIHRHPPSSFTKSTVIPVSGSSAPTRAPLDAHLHAVSRVITSQFTSLPCSYYSVALHLIKKTQGLYPAVWPCLVWPLTL